jgi:5-methyltetrahydrofolate--homocysteine methyltransferase
VENRRAQAELREAHASRATRPVLPFAEAEANRLQIDWGAAELPAPAFTGTRLLEEVPLGDLVPFIDWTFFFSAWELKGRFPEILDHPIHGQAARELYDHAQALLGRIVGERLLTARGVYGFWPADADAMSIAVYGDAARTSELARFPTLRQQGVMVDGRPNRSLSDYVAPRGDPHADYLGAFAVTAGLGVEDLVAEFERDHDDYHAIMTKALADRLAEACAEQLHAQARRDWGYGDAEQLSPDDLVAGRFRGIRPAFGYPACPDHSEKQRLFDLLDAGRAGIGLTESCAMTPAASVSGLYFSHPEARYFTVGRIGQDQVEAYAVRKGQAVGDVERWLAPNLAYDATPGDVGQ